MQARRLSLIVLLTLATVFSGAAIAGAPNPAAPKPYRVLVVIGDQWGDPGSYAIYATSDHPVRTTSSKDFVDVITMLKIWGIPFDILRLDEQRLQINRFLDSNAEANYACVIWATDPDKLHGYSAHYETLRRAVEDYGISLIALFDSIRSPALGDLVGVQYEGAAKYPAADPGAAITVMGEHFITTGLVGTRLAQDGQPELQFVQCRPRPGTQVLGTWQTSPQIVVRDVSAATKTVWIGGGPDWFDKLPAMRQLFRKALVHCMGYGLFNDNFDNAFVFVMDDTGCSEHAYSLHWHYPTPSKETLRKCLIEPLAKRGLLMVHNITPGYANPVTRMIETPWTIPKFTDTFGNVQDYGSTREGLDEGIRRGVFEIQTHRIWSHMNWDLDSPPGPWWDAPIEGERAVGTWYHENWDFRRKASIPPNDMLFLFKRGREAIERHFGVTPLSVRVHPGEDLEHDDGRLARIAGYGVDHIYYLGAEHSIQFSILKMLPEIGGCHGNDLAPKTDAELTGIKNRGRPAADFHATRIAGGRSVVGDADLNLWNPNWPDHWKSKRWIGYNETCAYLHSSIDADRAPNSTGFALNLVYDPHYCRHFDKKGSKWTLELSDEYLKRAKKGVTVSVDGKATQRVAAGRMTVTVPPGVGRHQVEVQ